MRSMLAYCDAPMKDLVHAERATEREEELSDLVAHIMFRTLSSPRGLCAPLRAINNGATIVTAIMEVGSLFG
jgi:hypothetical protein